MQIKLEKDYLDAVSHQRKRVLDEPLPQLKYLTWLLPYLLPQPVVFSDFSDLRFT